MIREISRPPTPALQNPIEATKPSAPTQGAAASFRSVLEGGSAPTPASPTAPPSSEGAGLGGMLKSVASSHREMDRVIRLAASGRSFSSAQLIGLQARVFRLSTEIDLASKLLEKATSGVKQAMSTQV